MSKRELKYLLATSKELSLPKSREYCLRSNTQVETQQSMSQQEEMEAQVSELKLQVEELSNEVSSRNVQLEELEDQLIQVKKLAETDREQSQEQLKEVRMLAELNCLRAIEKVREEHQVALLQEQATVDRERVRAEGQVKILTASFDKQKAELECRIRELTDRVSTLSTKGSEANVVEVPGEASDVAVGETAVNGAGNEAPRETSSSTSASRVEEMVIEETTHSTSTTESESTSLVATMAKLLKAQTEAIAAQTQAAAAQHLPPLKPFTGEDVQVEEKTFERWLELFEERAKLAGWEPTQQLHQLKLLLDKTALRAFRTFQPADRENYSRATAALQRRFKLVNIEELRGLEFHHKVQGKESIEELGMELQTLGHRAFPSSHGREFDRLLKGRFFQAIHVKWQRKLGAPKPGETFQELFDRARVLEQHEKQYAESAASRGDPLKSDKPHVQSEKLPKGNVNYWPKHDKAAEEFVPIRDRVCFNCRQTGHMSNNCPKPRRHEAPGQSRGPLVSKPSRNAVVGFKETTESMISPECLSIQELQDLLAQQQLREEQKLLDSNVSVIVVRTRTRVDNHCSASGQGRSGW